MSVRGRKLSFLVAGALITTAFAQAPDRDRARDSLTTREHLKLEMWWPTKQSMDESQFAGKQACAGCHGSIVRTQSATQMALTMMPASESPILATHTGNIFTFGSYRYAVAKAGNSFLLK